MAKARQNLRKRITQAADGAELDRLAGRGLRMKTTLAGTLEQRTKQLDELVRIGVFTRRQANKLLRVALDEPQP